MQGFRMRWVAEPDHFDDVFQRETDEAGLAVLRLLQEGRKDANIFSSSGVIWRILVQEDAKS
jgi:hypothetical protein